MRRRRSARPLPRSGSYAPRRRLGCGTSTPTRTTRTPGDPKFRPAAKPRNPRAITFANIGKLIDEVTILYGEKPIWITEYGYETSPPDRIFGVTWDRQATYMHEAYTIARRNPRIDMLLWFLVRDERRTTGWQSGLVSAGGLRKPAFFKFQRLAEGVRRHHLSVLKEQPDARAQHVHPEPPRGLEVRGLDAGLDRARPAPRRRVAGR